MPAPSRSRQWSIMAPDQPRECFYCGERIAISREQRPLCFVTGPGEKRSFHVECRDRMKGHVRAVARALTKKETL